MYHDALFAAPNITVLWDSVVTDLIHKERVEGVKIQNVKDKTEQAIPCAAVFVSIGRNPVTSLFGKCLALDASGYIIADETTKTNIPGVYAVGDVRTKALRQVVTAVADGATAAHFADEYLFLNEGSSK